MSSYTQKAFNALSTNKHFKRYLNTALLVVILLFSWATFSGVNAQQASVGHIYVQMVDGKTIEAVVADSYHRDDVTVQHFAQTFVQRSLQWQADIPPQIFQGRKYPSALYAFSLQTDPKIHQQWLDYIEHKYKNTPYPFEKFYNGTINAIPAWVDDPIVEKIGDKTWKAEVIMVRHFWNKKGVGLHSEPLHFQLMIEAVQPNTVHLWGKPDTLMGQALNEAQRAGMRITKITDLENKIL